MLVWVWFLLMQSDSNLKRHTALTVLIINTIDFICGRGVDTEAFRSALSLVYLLLPVKILVVYSGKWDTSSRINSAVCTHIPEGRIRMC